MSSPRLVHSPRDSAFVPRREFHSTVPAPSMYSMLAFSGPNYLRLSNFPDSTLNVVYMALDAQELVKSVKEDRDAGLCKFILSGKPWSAHKSGESESLTIQILAAILSEGFQFLSLIDYGKEAGDILSLVFSKPVMQETSPQDQPEMCHVPFGLSFVSSSVVRVVNPPLAHTPAILKAIREAWPRGTVSERKIGSATFEFKLKGYGWLKEDTFYADSHDYTLKLLSALSLLGFNLLTSLSFTPGRSGEKDFWIMVGSDVRPNNSSVPSMSTLFTSSSHSVQKTSLDGRPEEFTGHVRCSTAPTVPPSHRRQWSGIDHGGPTHAATDPTYLVAKAVPLDLPRDVDDAISWDDGSERAPSPLPPRRGAPSPEDEDEPATPPPARLSAAPVRVRVTEASSPPSLHVPIEEAPDLRASQIMYATPSPPRFPGSHDDDSVMSAPIMRGPLAMHIPVSKPPTPAVTPGREVDTPGIPPFPGGFPPA